MIRSQLLPKGILASILSVLFVIELLLPGTAPRTTPPPTTLNSVSPPNKATKGVLLGWTRTVLARPLFRADRRPPPSDGKNKEGALPRLSAIIISRGDRSAIFTGAAKKPLTVSVGGHIGGYRLEAITPNQVSLIGPDGQLILRPQFSDGLLAVSTTTQHHRFTNDSF